MKAFMWNGYPRSFIRSAASPREHNGEREEERPPTVHLPYVAGVSERIRRVCRDFDIRVVFKSGSTLRSLLTKVKDPFLRRSKQTLSTKCHAPAERCMPVRLQVCHSQACLDRGPSHPLPLQGLKCQPTHCLSLM